MSVLRGLGLSLILWSALGAPSNAGAWTRTMVESADAVVEVNRDASMDVLLTLHVQVHAGWLHELELAGLGDEVTLDGRRPPYLRAEDGEVYRPEAELTEDNRIRLSFERRGAPRKGKYKVILRYRTQGVPKPVTGTDKARITWSLPAWETGLQDVTVDIRAPRGAVVPEALVDTSPGVVLSVTERPGVTQLEWRRVHLPRQTPWSLSFDVPTAAVDLPPVRRNEADASGFRPLPIEEERSLPWAICLLALVALLKRRAVEVTIGGKALLVRAPWLTIVVGTVAVVVAAWFAGPYEVFGALALLLLVLHRTPSRTITPSEHGWRGAVPRPPSRRETPLSDLLDATCSSGAVIAGLLLGATVWLGHPMIALAGLPIFLTGTRLHRAAGVLEANRGLQRFTQTLRLPESAPPLALRWETHDRCGPRCRIVLPSERAGLLGLSFVMATRYVGCVARREIALLVQTRAQSDADDLVRRREGNDVSFRTEDGRIGRIVQWTPDALGLIRALGHQTPSLQKPRGSKSGTWLIAEMTEGRPKAA